MELIYAFDPNSEFQKKIESVFEATGDLTIPLTLIAKSWYQSNKSIFALKGPGRYADLSKKPFFAWWEPKGSPLRTYYLGGYKSYKIAKYGFAYPILKATGRLMKSITDPRSPDAINYIVNKNTLVLGTSVPYAIYHQSQEPRTKMPYRPFLFVGVEQIAPHDLQQARLNTWIQILDNYLEQRIK
jgi:phage gpG-like protein